MRPGTEIIWRHTLQGGWFAGNTVEIPGVVVKVNPNSVTIEIEQQSGASVRRNVSKARLITCEDYFRQKFNELIAWG